MDKPKSLQPRAMGYFVLSLFSSGANHQVINPGWPVSTGVESGTIQGQGCLSDVKKGLSSSLYVYSSLGPLM